MILKSLGRPQWRAVNSTTQLTEVLVTRRKPAAKACRAAFFSKVGWLHFPYTLYGLESL